MQKSYLLNPENSKTFLILSQSKMCQIYIFLLPRAHFLGATSAPTEPVHESLLKTPILSRPTGQPLPPGVDPLQRSRTSFFCDKKKKFEKQIFFAFSPTGSRSRVVRRELCPREML